MGDLLFFHPPNAYNTEGLVVVVWVANNRRWSSVSPPYLGVSGAEDKTGAETHPAPANQTPIKTTKMII